ncbi:MAG: 3-keto-5-aminohexanoate cleavage protein [Deltaproteobacteria bacterium]|nr:3-keto-5-aminohexanoate cleavage protein [Deltaproteobacteria bacterium]MBW2595710.1 3-keto-5-aminohexanoate cleavage protein [Deltaproteobacteria bacterium]MBW2650089.1 3-keto-5-aminohexanoate cleavage protein [Deltaproteobacteria bacterium]
MKKEDYMWDYRDPYAWMGKVRSGLPPLIISCAITGGVQGKEYNENLPETPEEQAEQTHEIYKEGASIVHVHARNPEAWWLTSSNADDYLKINSLIRKKCPNIIINNTTGGGPEMTIEQRMASIYANPEMCSLNLGPFMLKVPLKERKEPLSHPRPEFLFDKCIPASYADINMYAKTMKEKGIKPEMELYHPGMYWVFQDLMMGGMIDPPYDIQFVMGFQTGSFPTPANLLSLINELPPQSIFFVIGVGHFQLPLNVMSILLGGHVRVGMEDNVFYSRGRKIKNNAEPVARIVRIAKEMGREIATPQQAREMLGISQTPSQY